MSIKHNLFATSREIPLIRSATEPSLQPGATSPDDSRLSVRCAQVYLRVQWQKEESGKTRREIQTKRRHFHNTKRSFFSHVNLNHVPAQDTLLDDAKESQVWELGKGIEEIELHDNYVGQFSLTIVI